MTRSSTRETELREPSRTAGDTPELAATALVVTYNSVSHIVDCLNSLVLAGLAVRVVDNASSDGTAAVVAAQFPDIPLIANRDNAGFPVAVNQAFDGVDTDIVLLVNPDAVLPAETAREMIGTLRANPDIGAVGPRLLDANGRAGFSTGPFETIGVFFARLLANRLRGRAREFVRRRTRLRQYDICPAGGEPVAVERLAGAMMAVRTEVFHRAGGLDEGYFMYYEDVELCLAAWQQGLSVVYLPGVHATHIGGASNTDRSWTLPVLARSQLRFVAKHWPRSYQAMRLAVLGHAAAHVVLGLLLRPGRRLDQDTRAWARVARVAWNAHTVPIARQPCTRPS
jgi:N-acetylglucosaminyl-diphospho-decaprenol L-rhamnosyltransferase